MGCGLRKMKPVSEENSPGKIYSTLKRPQVETKVGMAYTYRYLDFLIGKDGKTDNLLLNFKPSILLISETTAREQPTIFTTEVHKSLCNNHCY